MKAKVNLLIVATGKYTRFLHKLLASADKYFLPDCDVRYCIFSDKELEFVHDRETGLYQIEHRPFPFPTLYRFHFFQQHKHNIPECDYFFYLDADALFVDFVHYDVLSERTAVLHCGFVGERGTYETRKESAAYVAPDEGEYYFGGGLWSFSKSEFWKLTHWAVQAIDKDAEIGIVPVWHDESVLNRWLIDNPPINILSPSYHYPENNPHIYNKWSAKRLNFKPVVLMLDKNHKEVRA